MQKRKGKIIIRNVIALSEIFIIVLAIFAFATIISETNLVTAEQREAPPQAIYVPKNPQPGNTYLEIDKKPIRWTRRGAGGIQFGVDSSGNEQSWQNIPRDNVKFLTTEEAREAGFDIPEETPIKEDKPFDIQNFIGSIFSGDIVSKGTSPFAGLVSGLSWGLTLYGLTQLIAPFFGADQYLTDALAAGLGAGIFTGRFLIKGLGFQGSTGTLIGLGVGIVVFLALYEKEKSKVVNFECLPWEAPLGGHSCEKCNEDPYRPCSEYRCKSLGQACQIVNSGTENEKCVWVNPGDVNAPTITPWDEPLTDEHKYTSHSTLPPNLGTKIVKDSSVDGCLQAFTPLKFGVLTNEPAQCKVDYLHTDNFEEMQFFFGNNNFFQYNHTQELSLPSPDSLNSELPELQNDGAYDLFVRCRDANGNENVQEFAFEMCVDPSPDTTPPVIEDTSINSGSFVAHNVDEVNLSVFVNEPAECKWSIQDRDYKEMENEMKCSKSIVEQNAQQLYTCSTTLTGVKNLAKNDYYFRCKDQPSKPDNERNVNAQSYVFTLFGSQPLNIIDFGPDNETVTGSTSSVKVDLTIETSNGAEEGKATCFFSDTGEDGTYVAMFETDGHLHKQTLTLTGGSYKYYYRCVDSGGNSDDAVAEFAVFVDTLAPSVTRAYRDIDALKIVTNEEALCVYSLNNCNYNINEGLSMFTQEDGFVHLAPWQPNIAYYIKCRDLFNNQPNPNQCSIVASASNII